MLLVLLWTHSLYSKGSTFGVPGTVMKHFLTRSMEDPKMGSNTLNFVNFFLKIFRRTFHLNQFIEISLFMFIFIYLYSDSSYGILYVYLYVFFIVCISYVFICLFICVLCVLYIIQYNIDIFVYIIHV